MKHINEIHLIGVINREIKIREIGAGCKCEINLLTRTPVKKTDGTTFDKFCYHPIESWSRDSKSLNMGDVIEMFGVMETSSWDGKDGKKVYKYSIRANSIKVVGKEDLSQRRPKSAQSNQANNNSSSTSWGDSDASMDDVPF